MSSKDEDEDEDWCMIDMTPEIDKASEIVRIFEHQRKVPIAGFGPIMLPGDPPSWTDETGRKIDSKALNSIRAGEGWQWTSNWESLSDTTSSPLDSEGWSYARSFSTPSDRWHGNRTNARVRRRCWIRKRRRTDSAAEANRLLRAGRNEADRQREELHRRHSTLRKDMIGDRNSSSSKEEEEAPMSRSLGALETSVLGRSVVLPDRVVDDIVDAVKQLQRDAADRAAEGKWDEAIACLTKAIEADCTKADLYAARSRALCVKGEYARALTDANVCIAIEGSNKSCIGHCCKGQALLHMRQFESAESAYKRALQHDSENAEALRGLSNAQNKEV